jgi:hypothetical protein
MMDASLFPKRTWRCVETEQAKPETYNSENILFTGTAEGYVCVINNAN